MTVRRQPPDSSTGPPELVGGTADDGSTRKPSKGDLTAQAILDTAEHLLANRSLGEIGIDELAAGAGVSRSTFYFHFESRDDVLYTLSDRLIGEIYAEGLVWFRRGDEEPVAAVRRALTRMVELWRAHGPVLRASVRGRETDPRLAELWSEIARRFMRSTAVQIESERNAGLALPGPPSARGLARALVIMNEATCYQQTLMKKSAAWDEELVESLTAIWVRSIYGDAVKLTP
ncbi:TetR/AcrR family transcriptional regulator [Actinocrispum wychmicini]|uniref:TetR family transcriptional regulator n=1 Tax=Actinocrispum wychmicini TaxID=1213861 RepID=A0A4R2IWR8_9PSEU|nr:TetR/AcrR family transcriptional regulator [Actinocrispum wychmicini]TCO48856.1 TetR family transcriptional regulator [Actinocrispum wychmicini]